MSSCKFTFKSLVSPPVSPTCASESAVCHECVCVCVCVLKKQPQLYFHLVGKVSSTRAATNDYFHY